MQNIIQKNLSGYHLLSDATCAKLAELTEVITIQQNDIFEKENSILQSELLILDGVIRCFVYSSTGKEVTLNFFTDKMAVTPTLVRGFNDIALYNLQVLSKKAELLAFDKKRMHKEMQGYLDLKLFSFSVMMEDAKLRAEKEVVLLSANGKEKLEWFRKRFPNLENQIQHYHIASYLGLTPTSLSRIRSEISKSCQM